MDITSISALKLPVVFTSFPKPDQYSNRTEIISPQTEQDRLPLWQQGWQNSGESTGWSKIKQFVQEEESTLSCTLGGVAQPDWERLQSTQQCQISFKAFSPQTRQRVDKRNRFLHKSGKKKPNGIFWTHYELNGRALYKEKVKPGIPEVKRNNIQVDLNFKSARILLHFCTFREGPEH